MNQRKAEAVANARQNFQQQLPWLENLPGGIGTVLDVGCGPGFHCEYFLQRGMKPTGIDRYREAFLYQGRIEFLNIDFSDLPPGRTFDAVFCSHILEHCPNPVDAIQTWRARINPNGYLIVIVPKYEPLVSDDHWHVGWNVGQLAMLLVACGFDCRQSYFAQEGFHVMGFGRRSDFPPTKFNIAASLPHLPQPLSRYIHDLGVHPHLPANLKSLSNAGLVFLPTESHLGAPAFRLSGGAELHFDDAAVPQYADRYWPALDLAAETFQLLVALEGEPMSIAVAFGSGPSDPFSDCAEMRVSAGPGLNTFTFSRHDVPTLRGQPDFTQIRQLSVGGQGAGSLARIWLSTAEGHELLA